MLVVPGTSLPAQHHQPGISTWLEPFMNPYLPHNYQHPSVSLYNAGRKYFDASKNIFHCVVTKICIATSLGRWLWQRWLWAGWEAGEGDTWLSDLSGQTLGAQHQLTENTRHCHHSTIAILDIRTPTVILSSWPRSQRARRLPGWCRHLDPVLMLVIIVKRSSGCGWGCSKLTVKTEPSTLIKICVQCNPTMPKRSHT